MQVCNYTPWPLGYKKTVPSNLANRVQDFRDISIFDFSMTLEFKRDHDDERLGLLRIN